MVLRNALCGVLLCVAACWGLALGAAPGVDEILAKTPGKTIAEGQKLAAQLVELGPAAIRAVCQKLADPAQGGDLRVNAKARFALSGLAMYVSRPGAEAERKTCARALIGALAAERRLEVRKFLVRQLQLAGKDEAVAPLARLLPDKALCEPATQALLAIRTPAAADALLEALPAATGARRVTVVRALGRLRVKAAAQVIIRDAASRDTAIRRAALYALANIGDPSAGGVLVKAAEAKEGAYERARATSFLLLFARRLAEGGRKAECAKLCRDLIKARTAPRERNAVCAALRTLVVGLGDEALPDLMAAIDHEDKQVRAAALRLAQSLPGEAMTKKWVDRMKQAPPAVRVEILGILGRRGDRTALPAILDALKDTDKAVRLAAIPAAARLGGADALAPLLAALDTDQADEIRAVQGALQRLGGERLTAAVAAALPKVPTASRVSLLEILAARNATAHVDAVFAAAADKDRNVRLGALKALGTLADGDAMPRLVPLLLGARTSRERAAAQKAIVTVARKIPEADGRADAVLAAMATATGEQRAVLLGALARIGGGKALAAVRADTTSADADLQNAAIRALADWQDVGAAPELLNILRTAKELPHQVLATRGYVRIVGAAAGLPDARKVEMYRDALAAARRPEEKKLVLAGLASVRSLGSLKLAAASLDDKDLAEEAAAAAVRIACPHGEQQGLRGTDVVAVLKKVVATTRNAATRKQAQDYLDNMPMPDALNIAQGKRVKTSVRQQGSHRPELAVDGNSRSLRSAWFGDRWPCVFQVDLGKPAAIDAAHVFFYWDGRRYYQYTLDVSTDGKTWATVADMSKANRPCTPAGKVLRFKPVTARYVRLNILKNSINEAVHLVELKVYAEGKGPKPR